MVELDGTIQAKVKKQIEFYFSDSNLPKDQFLKQQVEAHPEGYVDLSLIISFQRMRDVLKVGTVRPEEVSDELVTAVAGALQGSQLMEVHASGFQVRRRTALPSAREAARAVDSRSLYVRPFPMHTTLDQIVAFFQEAGASLNGVRVRRHPTSRDFKGSVFVEASSVDEAQRLLGLSLEFEGAPLRMERKQHYLARKIAERKAKKLGTSAEELTLAMLEEMDSDIEIPALSDINKSVQLPPAGANGAPAAAPAPAAQAQEQPPAKKQKHSDQAAAADVADADMADAAAEEPAVAAEPEVEQYDAGCILLLTLQGQPTEPNPYKLTKMIKEALGFDKIRFVEERRRRRRSRKQSSSQRRSSRNSSSSRLQAANSRHCSSW
ncbi:La domain-containing protein [Scenedesmus sp. NREL 46B-D3]|nr:La domain-containing protein [Scenedesmus sp. NREL 46B-D3]